MPILIDHMCSVSQAPEFRKDVTGDQTRMERQPLNTSFQSASFLWGELKAVVLTKGEAKRNEQKHHHSTNSKRPWFCIFVCGADVEKENIMFDLVLSKQHV